MRGQPLWLGSGGGGGAAKVVSGPGLASTEATPDWTFNEDGDWSLGLMMSAMTLQPPPVSSQSAGNSQRAPQPPMTTTLTRAASEPVSVLAASYAIDYHCPRSFAVGSALHAYLAKWTPQFVNAKQRVYTLRQVIPRLNTHFLSTVKPLSGSQILL